MTSSNNNVTVHGNGPSVASFTTAAKSLAKNPLGIVALFILLVYMLASVALFGAGEYEVVIVWFLVLFPVLVFAVFVWLVVRHHHKLYAPSDFRDEQNFIRIAANLWAADKRLRLPAGASANPSKPSTPYGLPPTSSGQSSRHRVLWVDDNPENNKYERHAFEAAGVQVSLALSTSEALVRLSEESFAAIISDMARREGTREGYVLLDTLRSQGNNTRLYFYTSSNAPEHKRETHEHGGQGCTNDPVELFQMVIRPHDSDTIPVV